MGGGSEPTPKIIVDTDWKSQAQAEKERLAAVEAKSAPKPAPGTGSAAGPTGLPHDHVEANFEELLRLLASQALLYLGAYPDPETGRAMVSLELAKLHIDLLGVVEAKTKNNLTEEETRLLSRTLHELRLHYVEMTKAVAKAVEEGRISRRGAPSAAVAPVVPPKL
jgi:hypothetical protein